MMLSFRTSRPDKQVVITAFVEEGVLNFRVNCGPQEISFSDPRQKVDNGFLQSVEVKLGIEEGKCVTGISLNETHTMRGEQEVDTVPKQPNIIYFGQLPKSAKVEDRRSLVGFHGCMKHLQVNGMVLDLYSGAKNGRDVVECQQAACTLKPCKNGAICTQHDGSGSWFCNCPPGYAGPLCERLVCDTNPCQAGGTCLRSHIGTGFICLCPLGRKGAVCEDKTNITTPAFVTSVGGYSSYLTYKLDTAKISSYFESQFHFICSNVDQISLMFFLGQSGLHELGSDYMAVSYVKGHILLTWDLGSGPRRIFTHRPVDPRYVVHSVKFGRSGRQGWLQVDQFPNITGKAPGLNDHLNVSVNQVFLGGHVNHNFTLLPHDLPVHRGFDGCIFDFTLKSASSTSSNPAAAVVPLAHTATQGAGKGRNVFQCYHDICSSNPCNNGGTCIAYGASFTCICPDGKFGVTCNEESPLCTTGKHKCAQGSECSVHQNGSYFCKCPFGRSGPFCDKDKPISDVRFTGYHSELSKKLTSALHYASHFEVEVKPEGQDGTILYLGQSGENIKQPDFLSLNSHNQSLVLSINLGGSPSQSDSNLVLTLCCLKTNEWNLVKAGRIGSEAYLHLNGQNAKGSSTQPYTSLDVEQTIYLGSSNEHCPTAQDFDPDEHKFKGCIRNLKINGVWQPLTSEAGWKGWEIEDCDGTACGGEQCQNEGTCSLNENKRDGFECQCEKPYVGKHCDVHELCAGADGCANGATCEVVDGDVKCNCPLGYGGLHCQRRIKINLPSFRGNGHLRYELPKGGASLKFVTNVSLEIKTKIDDALFIWFGEDLEQDDYLGVGLRGGMVHLAWNLGWKSKSELTLPKPVINDGLWHKVEISRSRQRLDLRVDGELFGTRVDGSYSELNVNRTLLVAGPPDKNNKMSSVLDLSRGHFRGHFRGCIRDLVIQGQPIESWEASDNMSGVNVYNCQNNS